MNEMHGIFNESCESALSAQSTISSGSKQYADIPNHLQISYDCYKNPWENLFMQDFIMVAEFSEQEGPRPLFTIPDDAGRQFDKNAFSVHVMSVDYHAQTGLTFSLVDDTQLIYSDDRENIHAYVHHYILHDIEGRGFVRPYCMCYISNSKKKIMENLEHFIHEFSKISNHFKATNRPLFLDDLRQRLADLNYVKECQKNLETKHSEWVEVSKNACKSFHGLNIETVNSMLLEANRAIAVVKPHRAVSRQNSDVDNAFEKNSANILDFSKTLEDTNKEELESSNGQDTSCYQLSNGGQIHDEIIDRLLRDRRRHLVSLRDIHALCGYRAVEGFASLQKIHQHFYQPYEVFSVIQEETPLLDPFSSTFAIGGSFVMNFRKDIYLSKADSISSSHFASDTSLKDSYESARSELSVESFRSCVEENESNNEQCSEGRRFTLHTPFSLVTTKDLSGGGNFSDRTSSVNPSPSSASLCDLSDDSTIEGSYTPTPLVPDPFPPYEPRPHSGSTGDLPSNTHNPSRPFRRQFSASEVQTNYMKELLNDVLPSTKKTENTSSDKRNREEDATVFAPGSTPQYKVIYKDMCELGSTGGISCSQGTVGDRGRLEKIQCYAQQLCRRKADGPGGGILRVLRSYGYLVHLLYALLSGRTVVILADASHQRNVESLITSLWLFVPGHLRRPQQVVLWRTKPLRLTDLGRIKLVGLAKSKQCIALPNSVETYVSTLDFESGLLNTPPYQGEFLNEMLTSRRGWKSDAMFISYVHNVFLEISLKAFVCYFAISLRNSASDANLPWKQRALIPRDFSLEFMTDILDALGILGCDARIIVYFVDVITRQQLADLPSQRSLSDNLSSDSLSSGSTTSYEHSDSSGHMTKTRPIMLDFTQRVMYRKGH